MQETAPAPQKAAGALPAHPDGVNEATKQYAESLVAYLRQKGGQYGMSKIGMELKRPDEAIKIGKVMAKYPTWFRRSGDKGAPLSVEPWPDRSNI